MGRFDGYLLCADLDGTFLNRGGQLIERNLEALRHYVEEGGLFTLATGRSPSYIAGEYQQKIPMNTYLICFNGAVIYDQAQKKNLYETHVERAPLETLFQEKSALFDGVKQYFHTDAGTRLSYEDTKGEGIYKCVFAFAHRDLCLQAKSALEEAYGDVFTFNRSWPQGLELLGKGSDKGAAVQALRAMLGETIRTLVCVGDFENDLPMLRIADIGYAVDNALPEVKAAADRVTVSCSEGAIGAILEDLMQETNE